MSLKTNSGLKVKLIPGTGIELSKDKLIPGTSSSNMSISESLTYCTSIIKHYIYDRVEPGVPGHRPLRSVASRSGRRTVIYRHLTS